MSKLYSLYCGGLSENSHRMLDLQFNVCGKIKRYGLTGGSMSPGAGFVASKDLQHFELALSA